MDHLVSKNFEIFLLFFVTDSLVHCGWRITPYDFSSASFVGVFMASRITRLGIFSMDT